MSENEKYIVSSYLDGIIKVWDFESQKLLLVITDNICVWSVTFLENKSIKFIISGCVDSILKLWKIK